VTTYRPEFIEALTLLAEAFEEVGAAGFERPILVGGAAVEFYTGGAIASGDFDVITAVQDELERVLLQKGFVRPSGPGVLLRGLHHPDLGIGVEVVSGQLFDGASDKERIRVVPIGGSQIRLPPVEDMIADRMGQYVAPDRRDPSMLQQAVVLYQIARENLEDPINEEYLDRRIRHETLGLCDLRFLIEKADAANKS
jgi:hypothetical protein